ncbi:glycosyltransferase family 4 protein [Candidatus Woesearchaeota archaeon]|nr:glycosyltransferase family 4 protein [Candidatus Woesearchaeota archaeon]
MRLLFVLENYLPHVGGVEIVFKNLCEGLSKKGHKVTIVTHQLPGTKKKETLNGVRIIRVPCLDSRYLFTLASIPEVMRQAKKADIVHTTTYNAAFPAWLASKIQNVPSILTVHEVWLGHWGEYTSFSTPRALLHEFLEWCIYSIPRFDRYVCVSDSTKKNLKRVIPKRKVQTIHNGFDPTMWTKDKSKEARALRKRLGFEGKFVILGAGRPGPSKGFEHLLKAFPKIKKFLPDAILVLMLSLERQTLSTLEGFKRDASEGVIFMEPKAYSEQPVWRQMADCIVVPSTSEGFGYMVLESVASGTPVVASNTTSIPEVIYGKHLLVKPKNSKAIADGVISVANGKYSTGRKKTFSWEKNIKSHEELYRGLR